MLSDLALITISEARNYMADDEADAERLADLINGYSLSIRQYTNRQFYREDGATKTFGYNGASGSLDLAPFELRNLTSITLAGTLYVLDLDYQMAPVGKSLDGTWWKVVFASPIGDSHVYGPRPLARFGYIVTIVGDWGTASIPDNVSLACKFAVANAYRNPEGYARRTVGPVIGEEAATGERSGRVLELPPDAIDLLEGSTRHAAVLAP